MEASDYENLYTEFLGKVTNRIEEFVKAEEPVSLYVPYKYIMTAGGKRIRAVMTMITSGAVGGKPEDALDCGVAIEILHNFTLVHDDIMDRSPMRRNKPTIHAKWDEPTAILTGDVMVGHALRLLPDMSQNKNSCEIMREFSQGLIEVCEGQAYDMQFNEKKDVSIEDYILMITKKTARLLETSAVIGGFCGNANENRILSLRNYANSLGLAFQIQDDLLDISAEQVELGKTIGLDIVEGKKTFLIIKAQEKAVKHSDKNLLKKFMNENGLSKEYIPDIQDLFKRLGVFDDAQLRIMEYFEKADNETYKLPENDYTGMLRWLLKKLNKRKF
ncbi:MAG: polyprenyl synthetase family protein [bacterium]